MPILPTAEIIKCPRKKHCPEWQPTTLSSFAEFLPSWRGKIFLLTRTYILGMDLPSLPTMLKPVSPWHYPPPWHSTLNASDQGTHFIAKEMYQCAHMYWINESYHILHHPEMSRLIERQNGLLKAKLWCQLGDKTLKEWDSVSENAVCISNQRQMRLYSSQPGYTGPGIKGWK